MTAPHENASHPAVQAGRPGADAVWSIVAVVLVYFQFRGDFLKREQLTMMSARAGLSMDPGAKVTFNGVEIGRVATVNAVDVGGEPQAKLILDVDPKYVELIPKNVDRRHQRDDGLRQQVHLLHVAERPVTTTDHAIRRDRRDAR